MRLDSALFGLIAVSLSSFAAEAAPATPDEAQSIKTSLEKYLGNGGAAGSGPVTVTPDHDGYRIDIDVKQVLRALEPFGITVDPSTYTLSTVPENEGTWHVTSSGQQRLTAKYAEKTVSMVVNGLQYDGTYDPRIPGFTRSVTTYDSTSIATLGGQGGTQTRADQQGRQTLSSTVTGDGIVDLQVEQTNSAYSQDMALDTPPSAEKPPGPNRISMQTGPAKGGVALQDLHIRALTDLWAFFVAHPVKEAIEDSQTQLRDLLRQSLPLFKHLSQQGSAERVAVESPVGSFAAQAIGGHLDVNGLTGEGRIETEAKVEGLTMPPALVPPWAADLLPTAAQIRQTFSGYRLDAAAQEAINSFDLKAREPFTPETIEKLRALVGPVDQMVLTIAPSRIASKLLDLRFEGDVRFSQPIPDFHLNIRASGMDDAIKAIQAKAGDDGVAAQVTALMVLAKGYGKAEPDGGLSWAVAKSPSGEIVVNGVALPFGKGK